MFCFIFYDVINSLQEKKKKEEFASEQNRKIFMPEVAFGKALRTITPIKDKIWFE